MTFLRGLIAAVLNPSRRTGACLQVLAVLATLTGLALLVGFWRGVGLRPQVSPADIALVQQPVLPSRMNSLIGKPRVVRDSEPDAVPEPVAQALLQQLRTWGLKGPEFVHALMECSARHAFEVGKRGRPCKDEYTGEADPQCLVENGYGRRTIGQTLMADRYDLNGDGIGDYLIADRYYCHSLSANQSNVQFVMLSRPDKTFRLAYADWAVFGLEVVNDPRTGQPVVIERAPKTYGLYSRVYRLAEGRLTERTCIVADDSGFSHCPPPAP